jgi:hypothetical protein
VLLSRLIISTKEKLLEVVAGYFAVADPRMQAEIAPRRATSEFSHPNSRSQAGRRTHDLWSTFWGSIFFSEQGRGQNNHDGITLEGVSRLWIFQSTEEE